MPTVAETIAASTLATKLSPHAAATIAIITPHSLHMFPLNQGIAPHAPVEIGSLTKPFTALLFAQALNNRELTGATPIDHLLLHQTWPGQPAIHAGQLATHTSGLPRLHMSKAALLLHHRDPYAIYTGDHLLGYLRKHQPRAPQSPAFAYSNFGYAVLGLALEKAAAQTYANLLQHRILTPLHMDATTLQLAGTADRPAPGHTGSGSPASLWHFDGYAPCGAMVSTLHDLTRAARAFLDPSSPIAAALATTLQPRVPITGGSIGLAWILPASGNSFWHNGATAGYTSYLGMIKPANAAVVIVANQALPTQVTELGHQLLRLAATNERLAPPTKDAPHDAG